MKQMNIFKQFLFLFKDMLNGKNTCIRKYEQEIDSLTFRNQQLTSRVEVLQQELDNTYSSSKSKKTKVHGLDCIYVSGMPHKV